MFDCDVMDVGEETMFGEHRQLSALAKLRLDAPVTDIPRGPAITLAPGAAVASALEAMRNRRRSGVVVVQNHRPIGVVTDRDILARVQTESDDLRILPLSSVMIPCMEPLRDSDTVESALRQMCAQRRWHQAIVCRRGLILGALDLADISLWLCDRLTVMSVDAHFSEGA
jgi:predicted transcriptional regulator